MFLISKALYSLDKINSYEYIQVILKKFMFNYHVSLTIKMLTLIFNLLNVKC